MSETNHFSPLHAGHSIEQAVFVIQFASPVDDSVFADILGKTESFKDNLPGRRDLQQFLTLQQSSPPNAVAYAKYDSAGLIVNELQVHKNSIFFSTREYTRWTDVRNQAAYYFEQLLPIYIQHTKLNSVGLSYTDKFICENISSGFNPSSFLKENSKYIAPHVYDTDQLWHSHTGVFERVNNQTKRLININLDYLDDRHEGNNRHSLVITSAINDQFYQPSYEALNIESDETLGFVMSHMEEIHTKNKEILKHIINDDMSRRIALID